MKKQSMLFKSIHAAIDELELLVIEGELLDAALVMELQKKFNEFEKKLNH